MIQYRVTKYDPQYRDASGAYKRNEWIMHSQIGESFDDGVLTEPQYMAVENAYVDAAVSFLSESGVDSLAIQSLENTRGYQSSNLTIADGYVCSLPEIADVARLVLRDIIWCKLSRDIAFLHFGWDYYMYIGTREENLEAIDFARSRGLFVEKFLSPYHPSPDEE